MTCSSCKYLDENKKLEGKVSGSSYYCSNIKSYVRGNQDKCDKHEKAYCRRIFDCDEIYNEGVKFYDDDRPTSYYIAQLIFTILFCSIMKLLS